VYPNVSELSKILGFILWTSLIMEGKTTKVKAIKAIKDYQI
jgi:hypothetical protein